MKFKLIEEFKEFAIKGNMIDIAVGVIIGSAFNSVVDVLVKEVFLPPLSMLTDGINYQNRKVVLSAATATHEEIAIGYGKLIEAGIDFFIISLTVFFIIKLMNSLRNKADDVEDKTVKTPKDIQLLNDISESLKKQNELLQRKS